MSRFTGFAGLMGFTAARARRTGAGGLALSVLATALTVSQAQTAAPAAPPGTPGEALPPSAAGGTPPSVEQGRELFARHCTRCHGGDARGTPGAPDLVLRVRGMSEPGFVSAVLQRYRWSLPASESGGESSGFEAMVRGILSRQSQSDPAAMPAWESEPTVTRGVRDLYVFIRSLDSAGLER